MIKKENTRICITIPKTYYRALKMFKKQAKTTYSKLIESILKFYFEEGAIKYTQKLNPKRFPMIREDKLFPGDKNK